MYDVYNNGFKLGGKLKVIFDRYFIMNGSDTFLTVSTRFQIPKYTYRRKMTDVTLRVGLVVCIFSFY